MSETKPRELGNILIDVAKALAVMFGVVTVWHRNRIEKDCLCGPTTAVAITVVAWLVIAVFIVSLAALVYRARPRCRYDSWRTFLQVQRRHVRAAIVPWLMTIVGIVLLTVPSQTADMLAGLNGTTLHEIQGALIPFGFGALAWALSVWFCSRWAIDVERGTTATSANWLEVWNPRVIALITGFAIVVITVEAAGFCSWAAMLASLIASFVFLFAMLRRRLFTVRVRAARGRRQGLARSRLLPFSDAMHMAPGGETMLLIAVAVSVIVIGIFGFNPQIAKHLQAPGTVLLGLGGLTVIGTFLAKLRESLTQWPVLLIVIIATTLLAHWDVGVNHDIRRLNNTPSTRPSLDAAAQAWLRGCGKYLFDHEKQELKVVLVSTAGGASRAALWTLDALSELEMNDKMFPRRVFAVSAVSGGALGATVWEALLAHENFDCAAENDPSDGKSRRDAGVAVLRRDFLAPVLAAWVSRDVPFGVAPINSLLRPSGVQIDDRSATLEEAWEAAWTDQFGDDLLGQDFLSLWNGNFNRPLLLLNGTDEDTGQPVVTAPVALVNEKGQSDGSIPATYDALWMMHGAIRTSTAILNAARFPVVTSQGDVRLSRCPDGTITEAGACGPNEKVTKDKISVVDGGYFDNIGAGTTLRVANALRAAFDTLRSTNGTTSKDRPFPRNATLRIMVVGINSDPDRLVSPEAWLWIDPKTHHDEMNQLMRCDATGSTLSIGDKGLANTLDAEIAPILAIVNTQSGHTALRMAELNMVFCSPRISLDPPVPGKTKPTLTAPANYLMLSLCPIGDANGSVTLPLNWILPMATLNLFSDKDLKNKPLPVQCGNDAELRDYRDWAAPP